MRHYCIRVLLAVALVLTAIIPATPAAQSEQEVAAGRNGQTLMDFIGRVSQNGANFTFIGYLTRVRGLDEAALFAGGDASARSEQTARFTIKAETTSTSRSVVDNLFAVDSKGTLNVFLNQTPGADFDDPGSFSTGELIASFEITVQNVISVIAPAQGVSTTWGVLEQTKAEHFRLNGKRFKFGKNNQRERIFGTGQGTLLDAGVPVSVVFISGNTVGLD
jgi:hypothetical protein